MFSFLSLSLSSRLNSCFGKQSIKSAKCLKANGEEKKKQPFAGRVRCESEGVDESNVIKLLLWGRLATESQSLWLDLSSRQAASVSDQLIKGLGQEGENDCR